MQAENHEADTAEQRLIAKEFTHILPSSASCQVKDFAQTVIMLYCS